MTSTPTTAPTDTAPDELRWGILGPGTIARAFAIGLAHSRTGVLVAAGSRDEGKAGKFLQDNRPATKGRDARAHAGYEALLADPDVQAVYIATPHPMHPRWAIAAARAGKHILVEKPITVNQPGAMAVFEAARQADVFAMEAYMYRCHPQTRKLYELVADGALGRIVAVQASFAFAAAFNPDSRAFAKDLAGGGILDVGGYATSMARLVAGASLGVDGEAAPFAEPTTITAAGTLGETGVDDWAAASLTFANGVTAHVSTGVGLADVNTVKVYGAGGWLEVPNPWLPSRDGRPAGLVLHRPHRDAEEIAVGEPELYASEADHVAAHLDQRQAPAMSWADTLGNLKVMDEWRAQIGLAYDDEVDDGDFAPVSGDPVVVRDVAPMPYASVDHVDVPLSRIVMGVDNQATIPHTSAMFDDFVARGGRVFDTAFIYGGGRCEQMLGQWLKNRGIRDDVVVIGKGAHTPHCTPEAIGEQLAISLDRLQTDHVDLYFMHRDDESVPVGEFVDAMDAEVKAGRIRAFGGSNWSIARFEEANAYAAANGRQEMTALSDHLSLAEALDVPWAGCRAVSDRASKEWLARTRTPLFPWSSQARGFFTGRARPDDHSDAELVRCYYSDENFQRLARAEQLGREFGVDATAIALAWLLHQPFPVFPLIGPRHISETVSSLQGLTVQLTDEQVRWLDLLD